MVTGCGLGALRRRARAAGASPRLPILSPRLLPVSELESALQMEPAAFQALYSAEKPKRDDENLIFFCQMGKRGLRATQLAQGLGYTGYGGGVHRRLGVTGHCLPGLSFPHPSPFCLHRARNYAGAYREWFQKEG